MLLVAELGWCMGCATVSDTDFKVNAIGYLYFCALSTRIGE